MHHHSHDHHHHYETNRVFVIGIILNIVFVLAEAGFGIYANSLSLLADAGHNASDVLGLFIAWGATLLGQRKSTPRFTYGLKSSSILAALANAIILLCMTGGIAWEAILRLGHPQDVSSLTVMGVAGAGIIINGVTALMFMRGSHDDLNIRGAFLHMAADAAVSLGVVVSGLLIMATGWLWLDPATGIAIAGIIAFSTWSLLKESVGLALQGVPGKIDALAVRNVLMLTSGVKDVHDLHIWAMSTSDSALSAHLVMPEGHPGDLFLRNLSKQMRDQFHIGHTTFQVEVGNVTDCPSCDDHC